MATHSKCHCTANDLSNRICLDYRSKRLLIQSTRSACICPSTSASSLESFPSRRALCSCFTIQFQCFIFSFLGFSAMYNDDVLFMLLEISHNDEHCIFSSCLLKFKPMTKLLRNINGFVSHNRIANGTSNKWMNFWSIFLSILADLTKSQEPLYIKDYDYRLDKNFWLMVQWHMVLV